MSTKLLLLALLLCLPLGLMMSLEMYRASRDSAGTESKIAGAHAVKSIIDVVLYAQQHRGLTNAMLSGDDTVRNRRQQVREQLTVAMQNAVIRLDAIGDSETSRLWRSVAQQIDRLPEQPDAQQKAKIFSDHTSIVTELRRLTVRIGHRSSLVLESDPDLQRLSDLSMNHFIQWIEFMGRIRGAGAGLLASAAISDLDAMRVMTLRDALQSYTDDMSSLMQVSEVMSNEQRASWESVRSAADRFSEYTDARFGSTGDRSGASSTFFEQGTQAIAAAVAYQDLVVGQLVSDHQSRLKSLTHYRIQVLVIMAIILLSSSWFMLAFCRNTTSALTRLCEQKQRLASGNLDLGRPMSGKDEMALLGQQLQSAASKLSQSANDMRHQAEAVAQTGHNLNQNSQQLTRRTDDQAHRIEQTAGAVLQLSGIAQTNAGEAAAADDCINNCRREAQTGRELMNRSVGTLESLKASSDRMREIEQLQGAGMPAQLDHLSHRCPSTTRAQGAHAADAALM